jgi:hypothetical protein
LLPYYVVAAVMQKSCRVSVPLCDRHQHHWLWWSILALGSFLFFIPAGVGLTYLLFILTEKTEWAGLPPLGCVSGILGWFAFIVLASYLQIRAGEMTDDAVKLTGACPEFIEAYRELSDRRRQTRRAARRRDDQEDRPRRPPRDEGRDRYREEDDRPRRRDRDGGDY